MPGLDGRGPGGRGAGQCNPGAQMGRGRSFGEPAGRGRGRRGGRGRGMCNGNGRGMGRGFAGGGSMGYEFMGPAEASSREDELNLLKRRSESLEGTMAALKARINELEQEEQQQRS